MQHVFPRKQVGIGNAVAAADAYPFFVYRLQLVSVCVGLCGGIGEQGDVEADVGPVVRQDNLVGAEYAFAIDDSIISFFIEGSYTSPYLYRRNHVDFLVFNRYSINRPYGKFPIFTYLGFPYGGDSIALYAECGYRKIDSLSVTLSLLYLLHGEVSIMSPHSSSGNNNSAPDIKGNTPTGDAYHNLCISLDVRYPFSISIFDIEGFINAAYAMSREKADAQLSVGVSVRI